MLALLTLVCVGMVYLLEVQVTALNEVTYSEIHVYVHVPTRMLIVTWFVSFGMYMYITQLRTCIYCVYSVHVR